MNDTYVSIRCRTDLYGGHTACRLSYIGVDDVTCQCECHRELGDAPPEWTRQEFPKDLAVTYGAHDSGNATMPEVFYGPAPVPTVPRWWYTTDMRTMDRIRFLPDYEPLHGDMVVVGMRASWRPIRPAPGEDREPNEMTLSCDRETGTYFRKDRTWSGTVYGQVFAPAPPPIGTWSGECPSADR